MDIQWRESAGKRFSCAAQEEALCILQREGADEKPPNVSVEPIIERMMSAKLTPQRSFDIVACAVFPTKAAAAPALTHSPQHVASHCLTFDSASESED